MQTFGKYAFILGLLIAVIAAIVTQFHLGSLGIGPPRLGGRVPEHHQ